MHDYQAQTQLVGVHPEAVAITPCSNWHEQYLPYNSQPLDIAPRVYLGHVVGTGAPLWVGCYNRPNHVNYGGAVGQDYNFLQAPPGYAGPCSAMKVRVMNGSYQWGPTGTSNTANTWAQSLKSGNVLLINVEMVSLWGSADTNYSYLNDPSCPAY